MSELENSSNCGSVFVKTLANDVCRECVQAEEKAFKIVILS